MTGISEGVTMHIDDEWVYTGISYTFRKNQFFSITALAGWFDYPPLGVAIGELNPEVATPSTFVTQAFKNPNTEDNTHLSCTLNEYIKIDETKTYYVWAKYYKNLDISLKNNIYLKGFCIEEVL